MSGTSFDKKFDTWADVLEYLKSLSPEQLKQRPMVMQHSPDEDEVVGLLPVVAMASVEEIGQSTHSADDCEHHPEQIVILADWHPFDEEGNYSYVIEENGMRGDKTGKLYDEKPDTISVQLPEKAYEALKKLQAMCKHNTPEETFEKILEAYFAGKLDVDK